MTPEFTWDDDEFPKGTHVFVGARKKSGTVYSRSKTANGVYVYGVRWNEQSGVVGRLSNDHVDCYCEASDMDSPHSELI